MKLPTLAVTRKLRPDRHDGGMSDSTHHSRAKLAVAAGAVLATTTAMACLAGVSPAAASAGAPPGTTVSWQACPSYSDDVLRFRGIPDDRIPAYRALLDRMECGTVTVPLDYARPAGPTITVALTRLRALDQAHRLGVLALNPGGPGGSGYLMPLDVQSMSDVNAQLNQRYDLIGFDPRGVGYSTKFDCPRPEGPPPVQGPLVGPLTETQARAIFDANAADNAACGNANPAFLRSLTTLNVARDLDRIRAGLGERRLNFLGVSWGTWLGEVYHTQFGDRVGRMFLDSVAPPHFRLDTFDAMRADAGEQDFGRMAAWMAQHNDVYGFGTTAEQVRAAVVALVAQFDAAPKTFTDLDRPPIDGSIIAISANQPSPGWPIGAEVLKELRDSYTSATAPPTVKQVLGGDGGPRQDPPPGTPEDGNGTMNRAAFCNEDPSRSDFTTAWAAYQSMLARDPATGRAVPFDPGCAGWPLPVQEYQVHRTPASVVLSGHLYESVSVYQWTPEAQTAIGGTIFNVRDDVHGSVLRISECAAQAVSYFNTGQIARGCQGVPVPDSTALPTNGSAAAMNLAADIRPGSQTLLTPGRD
jgi:pimeloyl-ACP methyl ester carboxylesterase